MLLVNNPESLGFFLGFLLKIIGFPNGPVVRYGNCFNLQDEEIFIPDKHGPFGNCIPVRVNQAIFTFFSTMMIKS